MRGLIYANCWIAVGAAGMVHATYLALSAGATNWYLVGAVAAGTFLVYNVDRLVDVTRAADEPRSERHRWIGRHRRQLRWAAGAAGGLAAVCGLMLPWSVIAVGAPFVVATAAYSFPLLSGRPDDPHPDAGERTRLKEIPGAKGLVVAAVWAGTTAVLPLVEGTSDFGGATALGLVAERFLFILGLTLPFDVRDLDRDRAEGVATVPMWLGVEGTRRLAWAVLAACGAAAWLARGGVGSAPIQLSLVATAVVVARLDRERGELYYVGGLDGMIVVQWLMLSVWVGVR